MLRKCARSTGWRSRTSIISIFHEKKANGFPTLEMYNIDELIRRSFEEYKSALRFTSECKRKPGFPILWFGDLEAYFRRDKNKRAVSIGVNPSGQELKRNNQGSFVRYPEFCLNEGRIDIEEYKVAMNSYFMHKQYNWFSIGMDCVPFNYSDGGLIHIDCCSSFATSPSWTGLCQSVRDYLKKQYEPLFEELLKSLDPSKVYICSNSVEKAYITERCKTIMRCSDALIDFIDKYNKRNNS